MAEHRGITRSTRSRRNGRDSAFIDKDEYEKLYAKSVEKPDKFWGKEGERIDWIKPYTKRQEHDLRLSRRLDQMVRGRHAQRRGQLHRPASEEARQQAAIIWEPDDPAEAPRHITYGELHREVARLRQCAEGQGRQARRPRHHLSADDPRGGLRHARLRADRRHSFGGVRRLLAGLACRPHRPTASRSSSSPPMRACAAAGRSSSSTIPTRR